jgi:hypothetical protein
MNEEGGREGFVVGALVKYIPSPSALFKWEKHNKSHSRLEPGIILRELGKPFSVGISSRRFEICWHGGHVTKEWINYLEPLDNSLTT